MNDSKIGLSGDFASPYVKASARPVQAAEKERAVKEIHVANAVLAADSSIQGYYPMTGEQWVTAGQVGGLEKQVAELAAENERLSKQEKDSRASLRMSKEQVKALRQNRDLFKKKTESLTAELEVTDKLLNEQYRVMDAIPECPVHGQRCIPHAVDWIDSIRTERAEIAELTAEKEEMLKLLYGRDLEIERLAEALGKCSQAREAALGK